MDPGCYYYFGVTGAGKTYKALEDVKRACSEDGRPILILDCMPDKYNLPSLHHEPSARQTLEKVFGAGEHAIYTPSHRDELTYILRGVKAGPRVHVLWDEPAVHFAKRDLPVDISAAIRGWRHTEEKERYGEGHSFHIVSQAPGDLEDRAWWLTVPEVYAFRLERTVDLERVRDEFKMDPAVIGNLAEREFRVYPRDRFKKVNA